MRILESMASVGASALLKIFLLRNRESFFFAKPVPKELRKSTYDTFVTRFDSELFVRFAHQIGHGNTDAFVERINADIEPINTQAAGTKYLLGIEPARRVMVRSFIQDLSSLYRTMEQYPVCGCVLTKMLFDAHTSILVTLHDNTTEAIETFGDDFAYLSRDAVTMLLDLDEKAMEKRINDIFNTFLLPNINKSYDLFFLGKIKIELPTYRPSEKFKGWLADEMILAFMLSVNAHAACSGVFVDFDYLDNPERPFRVNKKYSLGERTFTRGLYKTVMNRLKLYKNDNKHKTVAKFADHAEREVVIPEVRNGIRKMCNKIKLRSPHLDSKHDSR